MGRNTRRLREEKKLAKLRAAREEAERHGRGIRQRILIGTGLLAFGALLAAGTFVGPDLPGPEAETASLLVVFGIGLTAGGLSCLAVRGGLLAVAGARGMSRNPRRR